MKTEKAKSIGSTIKELAVSIASILIIIGSIAQSIMPVFQRQSLNKSPDYAPILFKAYRESPKDTVGIFFYQLSPDLEYRELISYASNQTLDTRKIKMRASTPKVYRESIGNIKTGECDHLLLTDYPEGDSLREFFQPLGGKSITICPIKKQGRLTGGILIVKKTEANTKDYVRLARNVATRIEIEIEENP